MYIYMLHGITWNLWGINVPSNTGLVLLSQIYFNFGFCFFLLVAFIIISLLYVINWLIACGLIEQKDTQ